MAARVLFPAAVLCSAVLSAAADQPDAAKRYTRFLGADISIGQGGEIHPVRDVNGGSWVIAANGQLVLVSAKNGPISMKISSSVKLTDASANLANLKCEGAYTPKNDPTLKMARALNQAADLTAGNFAASSQSQALNMAAISGTDSSFGTASSTGALGNPNQPSGINSAASSGDVEFFAGSKENANGYDALNFSFDVSAAKPLNEPYIVVITRFHEKGTEEGSFRNLVYAKALEPILDKPETVHFQQTGFPAGFELKNFEVHLYENGDEIATNVAPKREELTTEEAFEYVKDAYLKYHKSDTLGAMPVLAGKLPDDLKDRIAKGMYASTFYVRVSKDGLAEEPYSDAACTTRIEDPYLESVVRSIRFKPALSNGRPVDGTSPVNLSKL